MGRPKLKLAWIEERKARNIACQQRMKGSKKMAELLTILGDTSACLTFFNRDDGKMVAWPSQEEAYDPESYIKTKIKEIEKRLEDTRKVVEELEIDRLMLHIEDGGKIADLSQTELEMLKSFVSKKIMYLERKLGMQHPDTSGKEPVLGDEGLLDDNEDIAPSLVVRTMPNEAAVE